MSFLPGIRRLAQQQGCSLGNRLSQLYQIRSFAAATPQKIDFSSPVSIQKARTWDEGVASKFSTSSLEEIFKGKKVVIFGLPGAYTGVCTAQHVPSYAKRADEFKEKGVDSVICVSVNDPYTMNAWADKLGAKKAIDFYGDFNGAFHKLLNLEAELSGALLGPRSQRWSAYVVDGEIKKIHVEDSPADFKVSGADTILDDIP
eukprot:TRINITY_DN3063_c0_g1_i1.p2 TRINITY_DN3063_c0_g1~~TRINITY_DN3063_c0_g1_i1.p2  ORF type:complete len:202 (+),score=51.69 TRINITY_DN3063_c0_g1_i1:97-702(+)